MINSRRLDKGMWEGIFGIIYLQLQSPLAIDRTERLINSIIAGNVFDIPITIVARSYNSGFSRTRVLRRRRIIHLPVVGRPFQDSGRRGYGYVYTRSGEKLSTENAGKKRKKSVGY